MFIKLFSRQCSLQHLINKKSMQSFSKHGCYSTVSSKLCQGASTERFLEGKVALVTGATSGIGLGMARSLGSRGCNLIINGFGEPAQIKEIQQEFMNNYKIQCHHFPTDMTKPAEIEKMYKEIKDIYGTGIDVLVNNAGFQHVSKIEDFPVDKWDALIAVLLSGPFHLIRLSLPDMKAKKWGRIVNLASTHSIKASPYKSAYVSAKHGLAGLTKVVALEAAGTGVTCNAISPGYVETPILKMQVQALADKDKITYNEAKAQFLSAFHPSKEAIGVEQLAEMCAFLCTEAASQITGANMVMDGGWAAK